MSDTSEEIPFDISVQDLKTWRDEGRDLTLLDVREPHEHEICHIEGSILISMNTLPERMGELDKDALIVVHCHHGPRSSHAVAYLRQNGFARAANLVGGINAWSAQVDPSVPRY